MHQQLLPVAFSIPTTKYYVVSTAHSVQHTVVARTRQPAPPAVSRSADRDLYSGVDLLLSSMSGSSGVLSL